MWLDLSCFGLGDELGSTIVSKCHVALGEGGHYGAAYKEFMCLNIGTSRGVLEQALENICGLYEEVVK